MYATCDIAPYIASSIDKSTGYSTINTPTKS